MAENFMCLPLAFYKIRDKSMEPAFKENDFVLVNRWQRNFSAGDVVVTWHKDLEIIKRIKKISAGKFLLAGDSKKSMKPVWISKKELRGKVIFKFSSGR